MGRVLIAGCGFLGKAVARLAHDAGWSVSALTHSEESAAALSGERFSVFACDIAAGNEAAALRERIGEVDAILQCVSAGRGGGAEEYRRAYLAGAENLWRAFSPARFVFTSSTSVYAQTDGSWVDENSPAEPAGETGLVLREAERFVLERGGLIARLAGLYGPGRSVLLEKFLDGRALIEGEGDRWINQIHRDDAAMALLLLLDRGAGIHNVADDCPLTQLECHRWLAEHFQRPLPPRGPVETNRKRGWTRKRVSNRKLRELGWRCKYGSFKEAVLKDAGLVA